MCRKLLRTPLAGTGAYTLTTSNRGARVVVFLRPAHPKLVTSKTPALTLTLAGSGYGWRFRGDQFRVPWPQKYHHARTSVGYCKGISASTCQRRAQEFATQPCRKPEPPSANPNPTGLRDSTSGRPRVGAGGLFPYPSTHVSCLVPMLGPGHAKTPTKTLPVIGPR